MDAVSYPEDKVGQFIADNLIPLRIKSDAEPYATNFKLRWTPTLIILDQKGEERARTVGFLEPAELVPTLLLGIAKADFDAACYDRCLERIDTILTDFPHSGPAAEAVFLQGVAGFKRSGSPQPLKDAYLRLNKEYPGNLWTKRAAPYRLL